MKGFATPYGQWWLFEVKSAMLRGSGCRKYEQSDINLMVELDGMSRNVPRLQSAPTCERLFC